MADTRTDRVWNAAVDGVAVFLVIAIPVASLIAVALLVAGSFTGQRMLFLAIPLSLWLSRRVVADARVNSRWPRRGVIWLLIVLLLAFLLRWPPVLHLQSSGDPGVYMAMAGYFSQNGSLDVLDPVRERLASPEAVARFDANNVHLNLLQPGISMEPDVPGHYIFQFYPVHPAWMALFANLFGIASASASQVFFGIISLFFAALLIERLTLDWRAGVIGCAIFGLMPLHIFFSTFPISEMPTLAFAFIAAYAASRAADEGNASVQTRWLLFAALTFASLCLTRISGFVYLPVLYSGALLSCLFVEDPQKRRRFTAFWLALIAIYFVSVVYGLVWSRPYAIGLYHMHFGGRLLRKVPWILLACAAVAAVPFFLIRRETLRARFGTLLRNGWSHAQRWFPALLACIIAAGAARAMVLAFTDHYQGSAWYDLTWKMSHGGYAAILRSALLIWAENIGPALAILLPFALYKPGSSPARVLLSIMVLAMLGYTAVLQWFLPFQYYYARYLLSEVVPFSVVLVVWRCNDGWRIPSLRPWIAGAAAVTALYFIWFAWPLIGFREAEGAESSLARIASYLDDRSVLLVDENNAPAAFRYGTPLRMWFGKHLYSVRNPDDVPNIVRDLRRAGLDDIYLLHAGTRLPVQFEFVTKARFQQKTLEHSATLPRHAVSESDDFTLARLDDAAVESERLTSSNGVDFTDLRSGCCTGFVPRDIWTTDHAVIGGLALPTGSWQRLTLTMRGSRPDYASSDLRVRANGRPLTMLRNEGPVFEFSLGEIQGPALLELELEVKTFIPADLGLNDDPRSLGVDIASLRVD